MIDEPSPALPPLLPRLPILNGSDPEVEEEALARAADAPRTVLLTGAGGNVGQKLWRAWAGRYELIGLDRRVGGLDPELIEADLATWSEDWTALFDEADAVVHMAANPSPNAEWPDLVGPNLDSVANILLAAAESGVERVVLASSCHVYDGATWPFRRGGPWPVDPATPPAAATPYGASKLAAERLGWAFAHATGMTVVALRLGWILPNENRPETIDPAIPYRSLWLSTADLVRLVTLAVEAELPEGSFHVVSATSNNPGCPISNAEALRVLGYEPQDGLEP